jgi:muramoyltetrapeptide carboxypeptidase
MLKHDTVLPPSLQPGDTIGIVCPAGYMPIENVSECVRVLNSLWGFTVKVGKTVGNQYNNFSGTDAERIADLQEMLDDENIKAILCGRGGYGTGRIIDALDFSKYCQRPKWIIGFSDITVLHAHILSNYNIAGIHAPMAAAFKENGYLNDYVGSLHAFLIGKKAHYVVPSNPLNRLGHAEGVLIGGNLTMIAHLIGTPSGYNAHNKILFLEDIGEYLYNIDRMMYQLKRSGILADLKGLIVGGFTDSKDTNTPFGKTAEEIINDIVAEYSFPVAFGFPVSHSTENYALVVGGKYKLHVDEDWTKMN